MSIGVYRLQQINDPDLYGIGRREAAWLCAHMNAEHTESISDISIHAYDLEELLEEAAECDGTCENFKQFGENDSTNLKEIHDEVTVDMADLLRKKLARVKAENDDEWFEIRLSW